MPTRSITDFIWGPATVSIATVILAISSAVADGNGRWPWIVTSASFIGIHTMVSAARSRSIVRRLGRDYDRVQQRAVQVITDLARLAADKYDLWMVDLYVPASRWTLAFKWPFLGRSIELRRELSVSLVDVRPQPPAVHVSEGPHGECFATALPLIWFDPSEHGSSATNRWHHYDDASNGQLAQVYGVLSMTPIADQLGKNCNGVLAVHVQPEREVALQALGVLQSREGLRQLHNACTELNGLLSR